MGVLTRRLFSLPTEVKERYPLDPAKNIGWESQSQVRPSTGFPDQKESMCVAPIDPCIAVSNDILAYTVLSLHSAPMQSWSRLLHASALTRGCQLQLCFTMLVRVGSGAKCMSSIPWFGIIPQI